MEPLFEAMVAPCGHALCMGCLENLSRSAAAVSPMTWAQQPEQNEPRCPECRAAVHAAQYIRCYAIERAAKALHPGKAERFTAERRTDPAALSRDVKDLASLAAWKVARDEQAVSKVMDLVWRGLQSCMNNSTALLIRTRVQLSAQVPACFRYASPRLRADPMGNVDISEFVEQDAAREVEGVLETLWANRDEVARRLKANGLSMMTFRYMGENHALITWPDLPPTFRPPGAAPESKA